MATLLSSPESQVQSLVYMELVPAVAPELTFLWPRFETRCSYGKDEEHIGIMCDHPKHPRGNWFDPPIISVYVSYKLGARHQWLLGTSRDPEWRMRRVKLLLRLLLKKLAREVAKAAEVN